ncbi:hypothetical protein [Paenibacillus antibioticophila]|uniref:hypothetical protein n=1 Tax=Paenibacillus antibioticophila TaxID=1274374 RepID=UPI0011DCEB28|nr:hypothetical protein [Paenibacillus antibioticophila]
MSIPKIAELINVTMPKFNHCVDKALKQGTPAVLQKEQRSGQPSKNVCFFRMAEFFANLTALYTAIFKCRAKVQKLGGTFVPFTRIAAGFLFHTLRVLN